MSSPVFIILQRLRYPLLILISVYSILILGFTLIPGVDDQGNPWKMSFFHAFYFVSYMGSTIGFGEIPYTFTDAQRFWAIFGIYASVVSWIYSIGQLIKIIKDPSFQLVFTENSFAKKVKTLNVPFYLICGYGDTGKLLTHGLTELGIQSVVIDNMPQRIDALSIDEQDMVIPALCGNALFPEILNLAGLQHKNCIGVLALTHDNQVNLKIAITAKLLNKNVNVISRADTNEIKANMASFDTNHIINPYEMFAKRLALAIRSPEAYLIYEWFTNPDHSLIDEPPIVPKGTWLICGFGRFGKAVSQYLNYEGIRTKIIEARPINTEAPGDVIVGSGTEGITLKDAGILHASGLVSGTDNDSNNLSIIMTAKEIKKNQNLFTVARQNYHRNTIVFDAADLDLVMQPATIVAREILAIIKSPLLSEFLSLVSRQKRRWVNILISKLSGTFDHDIPTVWRISMSSLTNNELRQQVQQQKVNLGDLLHSIHYRDLKLPCLALMLKQKNKKAKVKYTLLPQDDLVLQSSDEILFCGDMKSMDMMQQLLENYYMFKYVKSGESYTQGVLGKFLESRQ